MIVNILYMTDLRYDDIEIAFFKTSPFCFIGVNNPKKHKLTFVTAHDHVTDKSTKVQ